MFYFFTLLWLRLQWVNINFGTRDLTSTQKSHPFPDDFDNNFSIKFDIKFNTFFFHLLNMSSFSVLLKNLNLNLNLNYYCQILQISQHGINSALSDKGCSSVPRSSLLPLPLLDMQPHQTTIFKSRYFQDVSV